MASMSSMSSTSEIFDCSNCGKNGHTFRECSEPIISCGIIAIRFPTDSETPEYLMIRRRDSLGYIEFLRGKYHLSQQTYIQTLVNQMTIEERQRLLTTPFDKLWSGLWNYQNTKQFRTEMSHSREMFTTIRNKGDDSGKKLSDFVKDCTSSWMEPEWGFPKGRRGQNEKQLDCALREFHEESGLKISDIQICNDGQTVQETFVGTNGVKYRHIYYIGVCKAETSLSVKTQTQVREVGGIGWYPIQNAMKRIRDYNPERKEVLQIVNNLIILDPSMFQWR